MTGAESNTVPGVNKCSVSDPTLVTTALNRKGPVLEISTLRMSDSPAIKGMLLAMVKIETSMRVADPNDDHAISYE
jgi:hypothetical protein